MNVPRLEEGHRRWRVTSWYLEMIRKEGGQALGDSAPLSPYPRFKADTIITVAQEKAGWQPWEWGLGGESSFLFVLYTHPGGKYPGS